MKIKQLPARRWPAWPIRPRLKTGEGISRPARFTWRCRYIWRPPRRPGDNEQHVTFAPPGRGGRQICGKMLPCRLPFRLTALLTSSINLPLVVSGSASRCTVVSHNARYGMSSLRPWMHLTRVFRKSQDSYRSITNFSAGFVVFLLELPLHVVCLGVRRGSGRYLRPGLRVINNKPLPQWPFAEARKGEIGKRVCRDQHQRRNLKGRHRPRPSRNDAGCRTKRERKSSSRKLSDIFPK